MMNTFPLGTVHAVLMAIAAICATPAMAEQLHVPKQFATIQAAIDAASSGDEIIVAPGVYNETIDIVSKSNLTLRSSGSTEATILDGTDLGRSMVRIEAGATGIVFHGFTLQNSDSQGGTRTDGVSPNCCGHNGGAMMVWGESDVTINHCVFRDNVLDVSLEPIRYSRGAALAVIEYSSASISNSLFLNNRLPGQQVPGALDGAAIYVNLGSSLSVAATEFHLNSVTNSSGLSVGGAVALLNHGGGSSGTFLNCTFSENEAARGGALYSASSNFTAVGCEFLDNIGSYGHLSRGGAIQGGGEGSVWVLENCVFSGNVAHWQGSAIDVIGATLHVVDSRFCDNTTAGDIYVGGGAPPWVDGGGNTFHDTCPDPPLGDLNGDGVINVGDLLILLSAWGDCPRSEVCTADLNEDGVVNVSDLLMLLANWG